VEQPYQRFSIDELRAEFEQNRRNRRVLQLIKAGLERSSTAAAAKLLAEVDDALRRSKRTWLLIAAALAMALATGSAHEMGSEMWRLAKGVVQSQAGR
jgi:hypothetical protein